MDRLRTQRESRARQQGGILMQMSNEGILVILFVGLIAGWLAGKVVRGTGFGLIGDLIVGIELEAKYVGLARRRLAGVKRARLRHIA